MAAPTCQPVGKDLLRLLGVVSLDTATPANQPNPIETGDLEDVATAMTGAMQELFDLGPSEMREQPGAAYLHAPTAVTLTVTQGSTTISALTTYNAWMLGCTIRIAGDGQDNEISSSTKLARPYAGASGTAVGATVYADCVQFDETVGRIMAPVTLPNQLPLVPANTRDEFIRLSGYPLVTGANGAPYPFFWFTQKTIARPFVWFVEGYYDPSLDYLPHRLRFAPMPDQAYSVGFRAAINPIRITPADIDGVAHADPGTKLPIPNGWVESIYLPMCRQRMTGLPKFKNDGARNEIARAYARAVQILQGSKAQSSVNRIIYT